MDISLNTPILAAFIVYSALMLYIGFYFFKENNTTEDYFLGSRNMGPVVSALSAGASDMSGWLLMGLPGALYLSGVVQFHIAIGLTIGASLNWLFVAKRLRIYTSVISNSITIPDYFETRFDDDKHILRVICAVVTLVFFTFYISSGLVGGAKLFEATFGLNYQVALSIGTIVIVAYTFFGGYKAVCWTDMIQGLIMMAALIIVPLAMLYEIGNPKKVYLALKGSDSARIEFIEKQQELPKIISILESKDVSQKEIASLIATLSNMKDAQLSKTKSTQEIVEILKAPKSNSELISTLKELQGAKITPLNRLGFL